jgi:hypothetical protein
LDKKGKPQLDSEKSQRDAQAKAKPTDPLEYGFPESALERLKM